MRLLVYQNKMMPKKCSSSQPARPEGSRRDRLEGSKRLVLRSLGEGGSGDGFFKRFNAVPCWASFETIFYKNPSGRAATRYLTGVVGL